MNGFDCTQFERWLDHDGAASAGHAAMGAIAATATDHAAVCAACARALAGERAVSAVFATIPGAPARPAARAGFADRVMARVALTPQRALAPTPSLAALPVDPLPWWIRAMARPEGALAFGLAGLVLLFSPQLFGLARLAPQWSAALPAVFAIVVSPWLAPILRRAGADPFVGAGVALALLPLVGLVSYAFYRLGTQVAHLRPARAIPRGGA